MKFYLSSVWMLFLSSYLVASAAVLEGVDIDYGNPLDPFANVIQPGASGEVFITIKNPTHELMKNIVLQSYKGACVEEISKDIQVAELLAQQEIRIPTSLALTIKSTCKPQDAGSFLLLGSFENNRGERERVWAEFKFLVAPPPVVTFEKTNIGLTIPDKQIVTYTFSIGRNVVIGDIGLFIDLKHAYIGDLQLTLIHPSGSSVIIHNHQGGGSDDINQIFGWEGSQPSLLNSFRGLSTKGTWTLKIYDRESPDTGILNAIRFRARAK